jgi:hypothetical protein
MYLKFGIESFNRRMNFGLWQIQVKDILIQSGLHKTLRGIPTSHSSDGAIEGGASLAECSKNTNIVSLAIERDSDVLR